MNLDECCFVLRSFVALTVWNGRPRSLMDKGDGWSIAWADLLSLFGFQAALPISTASLFNGEKLVGTMMVVTKLLALL